VAPRRVAAPAPPPLVPEAPVFPSARVRVAELAASMVWAAPLVALLALPAAAALGLNMDSNPQQVAYLFGMGLIGTWAALIPNKLFEGRVLDMSSRRLIALVAGLVVGAVGIMLGRALQLGLPLERYYFANSQDLDPLYFGALYAISAGWYGLASRDRTKRFRLVPIGLTALLAGLLTPLWPYVRHDGVALAAVIACTVQIVSPWSENGSRYAQYVRYVQKQKRKVKTA
jgi:eukaryotic-like serine/threonine-protein kinase